VPLAKLDTAIFSKEHRNDFKKHRSFFPLQLSYLALLWNNRSAEINYGEIRLFRSQNAFMLSSKLFQKVSVQHFPISNWVQ